MHFADLSGRVEYDHFNSVDSVKTGRDGAACIARSSDYDNCFADRFFGKISQAATHEPRAHIFERERGTVEELKGRNSIRHANQRKIEVDRFFADAEQFVIRDLTANERTDHVKRDLGI